jgi:diguanylate cyclase (GGDEF)-like protein/PAS domain S-box-containing protein
LVELSLVGIALIEDGRFTYVNRKLSDLFGYGVKEMMGMAPAAMAADTAKGEIIRVLTSDGEMSEFTFEGARKDKSALYIEGRSARMNFEGKPGLILTLMDVTERVRARQAVEKLQAQLLEQAIRDPLTGLYNRRYLDDVIGRELARAKRGGYPLALVMGDIDYFKAVNDTCGHPAGDAVLRRFAEMLRRHSRSGDILCRYGGEEFVLVLPHMDQETAYTRAEQLCAELAATEIIYQSMTIRVTASFGVAVFSPGQDGEALIAAADKALYRAKHAGRNTVTAYAA